MTKPTRSAIDSLADLISASRETTDRQISTLNASIERTNQAVEKTSQDVDKAVGEMQLAATSMAHSATRIEQTAERIEQQVGVMSEHLTVIDIKIERLADQIVELTKAVNGHLEVAKQQSTNISELTKLVAIQANTVATLINRTA